MEFGALEIGIIAGVIILLLLVILFTCYVKAPPSTAYVISGIKREPRILIGAGGVKIPIFERLDKVYLGQLTVDIRTERSVPTNDFINVNVDAVAKVAVTPTPDGVRLAARNFLNMDAATISSQLQDTLQGNLRELIGSQGLKELNVDRDGFSNQVMDKAAPDMAKLGISILAFNVQNITDELGLIENLGADNTWTIRKNAAITKAQAEKDIAQARAENEKLANDATVESQTAIAERQNELTIRKADLKQEADTRQAQADAAYRIQEQEQQKVLNEKEVEAQIARTKKEQDLTNEQIRIRENKLLAEVNKQADADRYSKEIQAEAVKFQIQKNAEADLEKRKREAEAQRYEAEQEAEAIRAKAEAQKFAMMQEAEGIKARGEAEAYAVQKKGEAEAQAMEKKAEAFKKYNDAAVAQMVIEKLPEITHNVAEQVATIKGVNIYSTGGDNGAGIGTITGTLPIVLAQVNETVKSAVGVDLASIVRKHEGPKDSPRDNTPAEQ